MFTINEWRQRYEVSFRGREPKEGEELRVGPLAFIRLKVYGHRQGAGYRRLQKACGKRFMEVFGIFCKFLEISGDNTREKRGQLFNERDEPATLDDLAFTIGIPTEQIKHAVQKLCDVGWVKSDNTTELNSTQHNTIKGKGPEISGNPRKKPKTPKKKYSECVYLTDKEHVKLVEKFGETGTIEWITRLNDGIQSKGYKYKSHYHTILNWSRKDDNKPGTPDHASKTKLFPIGGKSCSKRGCVLPAVYKAFGDYGDHYYCADHMPEKVKEKYYA